MANSPPTLTARTFNLDGVLFKTLSEAIIEAKGPGGAQTSRFADFTPPLSSQDIQSNVNYLQGCYDNEEWRMVVQLCCRIAEQAPETLETLPFLHARWALASIFTLNYRTAFDKALISYQSFPLEGDAYVAMAYCQLDHGKSLEALNWLELAKLTENVHARSYHLAYRDAHWLLDQQRRQFHRVMQRLPNLQAFDEALENMKDSPYIRDWDREVLKIAKQRFPGPYQDEEIVSSFATWYNLDHLCNHYLPPVFSKLPDPLSQVQSTLANSWPNDIGALLLKHLNIPEMIRLSRTCKLLFQCIDTAETWKATFIQRTGAQAKYINDALPVLDWDYKIGARKLAFVVAAAKGTTLAFLDFKNALDESEQFDRVRNLTSVFRQFHIDGLLSPWAEVASVAVELMVSDASTAIAHLLATKTRAISVFCDVLSRPMPTANLATTGCIMEALVTMFLRCPKDVMYALELTGALATLRFAETPFQNLNEVLWSCMISRHVWERLNITATFMSRLQMMSQPDNAEEFMLSRLDGIWHFTYTHQTVSNHWNDRVDRGITHFAIDKDDNGKFHSRGMDTTRGRKFEDSDCSFSIHRIPIFFTRTYSDGNVLYFEGVRMPMGFAGSFGSKKDETGALLTEGIWICCRDAREFSEDLWAKLAEEINQESLILGPQIEITPNLELERDRDEVITLNKYCFWMSRSSVPTNIIDEWYMPDLERNERIIAMVKNMKIFQGAGESSHRFRRRSVTLAMLVIALFKSRLRLLDRYLKLDPQEFQRDFEMVQKEPDSYTSELHAVLVKWRFRLNASYLETYGMLPNFKTLYILFYVTKGLASVPPTITLDTSVLVALRRNAVSTEAGQGPNEDVLVKEAKKMLVHHNNRGIFSLPRGGRLVLYSVLAAGTAIAAAAVTARWFKWHSANSNKK